MEIKDNVINKNFMITYDFSDNDFGGDIECIENIGSSMTNLIYGKIIIV